MRETNSKISFYVGNHASIYVPATITTDSIFPFDLKTCPVKIKIEGKKLIIEKL